MHRFALACGCCAVVLAGCTKTGQTSAGDTQTTTPPAAATPAPPAALSFNDVAGKWNLKVMNQTGDSTLITEVLNAAATEAGWTVVRGTLPPNPVRVSISGDSLIMDGGPYPSALRKGLTVTSHTVYHLQGGQLVGSGVAHYNTKAADSVRYLRVEGTRAP